MGLYIYPNGSREIFAGMTRVFLRRGYPHAWCLWREHLSGDNFRINKVFDGRYVPVPDNQLREEITQSFDTHLINYIMPAGDLRIYMSFNNLEETVPYFVYMMDGYSVYSKYLVNHFEDDWGLI